MDQFTVKLAQLSDRVKTLQDQIQTEEATKNAFVMPMLQILGYDVFNPTEVVPEYTADIGIKKGEKVDYAIFLENKPTLIIECKKSAESIKNHSSQLSRYFHTLDCKFALLTNGIEYRFYTDLTKLNVMDEKPFLKFDVSDMNEFQIEELYKFHKSQFNIESILNTASRLKYEGEIKAVLRREFENPSDSFIKLFIAEVYEGRATEKVVNDFKELFQRASNSFIQEHIKKKINMAFENPPAGKPGSEAIQQSAAASETKESEDVNDSSKDVETTMEEIEAFYIVKSILRHKLEPQRVFIRDGQSYCGVILDDNNRKPICRFWFNGKKKYLGLLDESKKETRHEIAKIDDLFNFSTELLKTIDQYSN
jgi:predicted type IV restriction endonuclease